MQTEYLGWGLDADADGIPDAFEFAKTGSLTNLTSGGDADDDGQTDDGEFFADTDPLDDGDLLEITALSRSDPTNRVTWTVKPTRFYRLDQASIPGDNAVWTDSGLGLLSPGAGPTLTGAVTDASATVRVYRANAVIPLTP